MLKTAIPFVDLRGKTPVDLLRLYPDKAKRLIHNAKRTFGLWSQAASVIALPWADRRSYAWLKRNANPYLHEIENMSEILRQRGVYALNLSYEWGCTSGVYRTEESVSMLRILDWPFPNLGKEVMVVLQQGKAGEFYNVTWPGMSGMFTGMARGRFCAALNLAPMRKHKRTMAGDWIKNRMLFNRETGLPPAHALRKVFETAASYEDAREMLMKTPLAVPAIFILTGTKAGEGCVIERLENDAELSELSAGLCVSSANHFSGIFKDREQGWRPREIDSPGRHRQSETIVGHDLAEEDFSWLRPPIINSYTRLCVVADAVTGRLMVQGFEGSMPVTNLFSLAAIPTKSLSAAWN